jgi:hypothetical protein
VEAGLKNVYMIIEIVYFVIFRINFKHFFFKQFKIQKSNLLVRLGGGSYTAGYIFPGVRYIGETIARQMKAATALKGTILQKTYQRYTFSSYSRINMNLKFSEVASF